MDEKRVFQWRRDAGDAPGISCLYLQSPSICPPQPRITPEILLFAVGESGDLLAGNQITAIRTTSYPPMPQAPGTMPPRSLDVFHRRRSPQNCWGTFNINTVTGQRIAPHHIGSRLLELSRRAYSLISGYIRIMGKLLLQ